MTLNFNRCFFLVIALALILPVKARTQQGIMHRGDLTIEGPRAVGDVVVSDGDLVVKGRVLGSVFLINGDISVEPYGNVDGNVSLLNGSLWVARGARVGGEINIFSGKAHIEEGAAAGSQIRALEEVSSLTQEKLDLISRYIIFNRKAPPASYSLENLDKLNLETLRLRKGESRSQLKIDLGELGEAPLNLDEVAESREVYFRGRDARVRVCIVRFASEDRAEIYWDRLRRDFEDKVIYSVHNSLGEGAHWYFRYDGTSYCLWYKGAFLHAIIVRGDDDDPEDDEWRETENLRDRIILEVQNLYDLTGQ